jgi:hypothetical protein
MKQDEQIDNLFRNRILPDFSEEIPENFILDINQRLDSIQGDGKKKRILFFWWITGGFSLIACLLFSFTWFYGDDTERKTVSNSSKKAVIKNRLINDTPDKLKQTKPKEMKDLISNSNVFIQNPRLRESFQSQHFEIENPQFEENKQIDQVDLTEDISNDDKEKSIDTSNSIFDNSNVLSINENDKLTKMSLLNFSVLDLNNGELLKHEARNKNQRISHYAGFYCGISSVESIFKKLNSPVVSAFYTQKNYLEKRKAEEIGITSWDVSFKYTLNYKGFTLSSGLDYFVWGEKTDYSNVNYSAQFLNKYQYLSIPINLGYSMRIGKYGINPFAGLSVGRILRVTNGYYLNSQSISSAFQATASPYATSFSSGLELSYYSQSGIKVSLMPITRFSVRQVVNTEMVSTNYFSIGLNLGIGYCW